MLISVIVAVYNVEFFLDRCIESIVNQRFEKLEIILINDCSSDDSDFICQKWLSIDKRIKYIKLDTNRGVSCVRNVGIENATGTWISFIDGDDYIERDFFYNIANAIVDKNVDICVADYSSLRSNEVLKEKFWLEETKPNKIEWMRSFFLGRNGMTTAPGVPWAKAYRKDFLLENDIKFPVGIVRMEDLIFNLYTFYFSSEIEYVHDYSYVYRVNEYSVEHRYDPNFYEEISSLITLLDEFPYKNCIDDWDDVILSKKIKLYSQAIQLMLCHKDCEYSFLKKVYISSEMSKGLFSKKIQLGRILFGSKQKLIASLINLKCYFVIVLLLSIKMRYKKI